MVCTTLSYRALADTTEVFLIVPFEAISFGPLEISGRLTRPLGASINSLHFSQLYQITHYHTWLPKATFLIADVKVSQGYFLLVYYMYKK